MEHPVADALGAFDSIANLHDLVGLFAGFSEDEINISPFLPATDLQMQALARFLLCSPPIGAMRWISAVPAKNLVTHQQAAFSGVTVGFHASNRQRGVRLALDSEPERGTNGLLLLEGEARLGEHARVGQRIGAADVFGEKFLKRTAGNFLSGKSDVQTVAIEPAGPREILIHGTHDVIEAALVAGAIADHDIEQNTEDLAFCVVRDAALGLVVERIFVQPGVQAGLFSALPLLGWAGFEFVIWAERSW